MNLSIHYEWSAGVKNQRSSTGRPPVPSTDSSGQACWWGYNYIVSKLERYNVENHVYFVTTKTLDNKPIFLDHRYAELFINNIFSCGQRYGFLLLGFVLMPDHFHALVMPKEGFSISSVMQKLRAYLLTD
jgi:hypothetical protein